MELCQTQIDESISPGFGSDAPQELNWMCQIPGAITQPERCRVFLQSSS